MRFLVLNCQHGQQHQSIIDFFHAHIRLVDVFILQEVSDKIRLFLETQWLILKGQWELWFASVATVEITLTDGMFFDTIDKDAGQRHGFLVGTCRIADKIYQLVNCHLSAYLYHSTRKAEIHHLIQKIKQTGSTILCGDFNTIRRDEIGKISTFLQKIGLINKSKHITATYNIGRIESPRGSSHSARRQHMFLYYLKYLVSWFEFKLDHIFASADLDISCQRIRSYVSDHYPLIGKIEEKLRLKD